MRKPKVFERTSVYYILNIHSKWVKEIFNSSFGINKRYLGICNYLNCIFKSKNSMFEIVLYILLGLFAGTLSGLIGIGGGVIIVPAIIILFGLTQHQAQGTTLALLIPPIGLLAVWTYYREGHVDLLMATFICIGFFIGGLFGAKLAMEIPTEMLKKIFGIMMILIGLYMVFVKNKCC